MSILRATIVLYVYVYVYLGYWWWEVRHEGKSLVETDWDYKTFVWVQLLW